jgi:IS5 family transposase
VLLREGTIVDATIIAAPPLTKNRPKAKDPEMRQTEKGNEWRFGMKAHIGVDAVSGLVHMVVSTAANVSDISQAANLLHGEESSVHADAGYIGLEKREEVRDRDLIFGIAKKRGKVCKRPADPERDAAQAEEPAQAQVCAIVEHPFRVVRTFSAIARCAIAGWEKTPRSCSACLHWPIWCWRDDCYPRKRLVRPEDAEEAGETQCEAQHRAKMRPKPRFGRPLGARKRFRNPGMMKMPFCSALP